MIRVSFEVEPPEAVEALALVASTGLPDGPQFVRPSVSEGDGRATLEFPTENWGEDVTMLVSALVAGEWADLAAFERCRLVELDVPDGTLPGPAFTAAPGVSVGAIVKPSLGLSPEQVAEAAAIFARGGASLVKDDELLGDPEWCPLEDRVRAVAAVLPDETLYAANVTGPVDGLLQRAERAVKLGATALMLNVFAQGLDSLRMLRKAELGVPLFAHRVGAALLMRDRAIGVAPAVLAGLTRMCGADFVQAGSFSGRLADDPDDVRACIAAARPATAVLSGGVGPETAAAEVEHALTRDGLMLVVGSDAYLYPGGPEAGI
ncbi:MAG TPA: RuBisCO large subunit C-terminal-like domain-containing protein, partial [Gaiellaceae bacterium]|nr:RuBisCO large subunit C-terminal-like domain-containing protein [Gaiellaceae bacterium]